MELVLKVLSGNNLRHASEILIAIINKYSLLATQLSCFMNKTNSMVVASLKEFVSHLVSTGTRTTAEKDAMRTIISACKRGPETKEIRELLGITKYSWYNYSVSPDEERYQHKERSGRELTPLQLNQRRSINQFCHSDDASHLDSNARRIVVVLNKNGE